MLVSHAHRFIYLKTHKTAGTSVEIYLERWCRPPDLAVGDRHFKPAEISAWGIIGARGALSDQWYNHMSALEVRDLVGLDVWSDYYKFCVVRNPFDAVVSHFWYRLDPRLRELLKYADFRIVLTVFDDWLSRAELPSNRSIYAIDGQPAVDFFIRFEALENGLEQVCRRLSLSWEPHRIGRYKAGLRVRNEHFSDYYTPRGKARVEELFAEELDHLDYSCGTGAPAA